MFEEKEINYKIDNSVFEIVTILKNYKFFKLITIKQIIIMLFPLYMLICLFSPYYFTL